MNQYAKQYLRRVPMDESGYELRNIYIESLRTSQYTNRTIFALDSNGRIRIRLKQYLDLILTDESGCDKDWMNNSCIPYLVILSHI